MSNELILMLHPALGVLGILAALWVFVETLNVSEANQGRIRTAGLSAAGFMWLTYLVGGYWYIVFYGADKALIQAGPWPYAHSFFMEMKEHVFLALLLFTTYLAIAVFDNLYTNQGARRLVLWVAALVVVTGLAMEGAGAFIAMGAKVALLANSV